MPVEVAGFAFTVLASAGAEQRAAAIAERTQRARAWMTGLLGFEPRPRLEVLDESDWAERASVDMYGMPHFDDDGGIYIAATNADLFDELVRLTLDDAPAGRRADFLETYGDPPNVTPFADLLALHELAHLYHAQAGFDFDRWWLRELFCNIALEGFVVEADQRSRRALETFPLAASHIRPERMDLSALDSMGDANGVNYGWYELRLHAAAVDIWRFGGRAALVDFYRRASAQRGRPLAIGGLHPSIARVATDWLDVPRDRPGAPRA